MAQNLIKALAPIRLKRAHYEARPELVAEIIASGRLKAAAVSDQTMAEVRAAIKI
jgi:tryptophanyl-tRNA synthetase